MMLKQKILIIVTIVLFLAIGGYNLSRLTPENENYKYYISALDEYNSGKFSLAYDSFGKVTRFSKLRPAAIYRQALCEGKLENPESENKKFKELIKHYPNTLLGVKAKYILAQNLYEAHDYKRAKKEFYAILKRYPTTDYAIASQYYLGSIEAAKVQKTKSKKKKLQSKYKAIPYFKAYLNEAPRGRFAISCIEKWVSLDKELNYDDNLILAKIYQKNQDYKNAQKYLKSTNVAVSWPYWVKNAYAMKDYSKVKYYTEEGIKIRDTYEVSINQDNSENTQNLDVYEAIDDYLKISESPTSSLSYLLGISSKTKGYDYLLYKSCNNMSANNKIACFNTLYYKYPDGQFAADALANIFYDKVMSQSYFTAKKIGRIHLTKYPNSKSTPKVIFWLAKVAQRTKNYEEARSYYKRLMREYPDDYYAYHAFLNLNRFKHLNAINLTQKAVEFPYKDSNYNLVTELAKVKDYGLINQLYPDNDFIQSWLAYLQGNFSTSARLARDAMDKLPVKPTSSDPRWELVYPIHYFNEITKYSKYWNNDPSLILSIIREESYFNPNARSAVGASGLMQLMPATASEAGNIIGLKITNGKLLLDPDINIKLGNIYYSKLKKTLWGKDLLAVLAYNGGLGSVSKWQDNLKYVDADDFVEQIPYPETQNYLKKVFKSYWNYIRIYDGIRF